MKTIYNPDEHYIDIHFLFYILIWFDFHNYAVKHFYSQIKTQLL